MTTCHPKFPMFKPDWRNGSGLQEQWDYRCPCMYTKVSVIKLLGSDVWRVLTRTRPGNIREEFRMCAVQAHQSEQALAHVILMGMHHCPQCGETPP